MMNDDSNGSSIYSSIYRTKMVCSRIYIESYGVGNVQRPEGPRRLRLVFK